jgi:hypothetical protein
VDHNDVFDHIDKLYEAIQKVLCNANIQLANRINCHKLKKNMDSPSANAAEIYDRYPPRRNSGMTPDKYIRGQASRGGTFWTASMLMWCGYETPPAKKRRGLRSSRLRSTQKTGEIFYKPSPIETFGDRLPLEKRGKQKV